MASFKASQKNYGIIHHDLHHENFLRKQSGIALFDFGDIVQHWFIYDIAISFYHALQTVPSQNERQRDTFAQGFLIHFLQGYKKETSIDEREVLRLPFFLKYRRIYSYIYLMTHLTIEHKKKERISNALFQMEKAIGEELPCTPLTGADILACLQGENEK